MLSLNLEGFKRNKFYLSELLLDKKSQIVFLQELWLPYSDQNLLHLSLPEYSFNISTPDMFENPEDVLGKQAHIWHGVAIGWRRDINASIKILDSTCDRIAAIKMELNERYLLLLSIYASTSGQDEEFLELISHLSDFIHKHSSSSDQVLIGGDSNCSTKSSKRRQMAWESFCNNKMIKTYLSPNPLSTTTMAFPSLLLTSLLLRLHSSWD